MSHPFQDCLTLKIHSKISLFWPPDRSTEIYAGLVDGRDRQTYGRQTVTLRFPLDAASMARCRPKRDVTVLARRAGWLLVFNTA